MTPSCFQKRLSEEPSFQRTPSALLTVLPGFSEKQVACYCEENDVGYSSEVQCIVNAFSSAHWVSSDIYAGGHRSSILTQGIGILHQIMSENPELRIETYDGRSSITIYDLQTRGPGGLMKPSSLTGCKQ